MAISIFMFHIPRIGSCETQLDEYYSFVCLPAPKKLVLHFGRVIYSAEIAPKKLQCDWSLERAIRNQLSDINDQATSGSSGKTRELFTLIADEEFFSIVIAVEAFN